MSDEVDDIVDGLPIRESDFDVVGHALDSDSSSDPRDSIAPSRIVAGRPPRVLRWAMMAGAVALAFACGTGHGEKSTEPAAMPPAPKQVTVTVTVTKTSFPKECIKALEDIQKYLDAAAKIASVSGKQLDILDAAYQAILLRDTKKLNDLADRQRTLARQMAEPAATLLPDLGILNQEIKLCHSRLK